MHINAPAQTHATQTPVHQYSTEHMRPFTQNEKTHKCTLTYFYSTVKTHCELSQFPPNHLQVNISYSGFRTRTSASYSRSNTQTPTYPHMQHYTNTQTPTAMSTPTHNVLLEPNTTNTQAISLPERCVTHFHLSLVIK